MADLEGKTIAATYRSVLNVGTSSNQELDATPRLVEDGAGNDSALWLATGSAALGVDDTGADFRVYSATTNEGLFYDSSEDEFGLLLTTKLKFHDIGGGEEMYASGNGVLLLNSGTSLTITTPTLDLTSSTKVDFDSPILDMVTQGTTIELKQQVDALAFDGAADNILNIDASNNRVGIGTASPDGVLNIEKAADGCYMYIDTYDATEADTSNLYFRKSHNNSSAGMTATPSNTIHGSIVWQGVNAAGSPAFVDTAKILVKQEEGAGSSYVAGDIQFHTADADEALTQRMVINREGNVGIGTTSPAYLLELEGDNTTALSLMNQSDTAIDDGDTLGTIYFGGRDEESAGTNVLGAKIVAQAAGLWGTGASDNDTPTELQFWTSKDGADALAQKMVITDDGKVGIGDPAPEAILHVAGTIAGNESASSLAETASYACVRIQPRTDTPDGSANNQSLWFHSLASYVLGIQGAEEDGASTTNISLQPFGGNVGIGKVAPGEKLTVYGDPGNDGTLVQFENSHADVDDGDNILMLAFGGDAGVTEGNFIIFRDNDTAEMGVIKANSATVVVDSYSDYRIKNTIATLSGGLTRVNALRPVTFKYNTDSGNATHEGFIAHEVQEHIPYAVRGAKDAVKDDGSVKAQSFCIYQLIPQLVSAIQELSAKVTALENA